MSRSWFLYPSPLTTKAFSVSNFGDNTIVAGTAGKTVRVFRMKMKVGGVVDVTIKDTDGNVYDGPLPFRSGNEGWILDLNAPDSPPWYATVSGAGFVINLSAGVVCGGNVEYLQI